MGSRNLPAPSYKLFPLRAAYVCPAKAHLFFISNAPSDHDFRRDRGRKPITRTRFTLSEILLEQPNIRLIYCASLVTRFERSECGLGRQFPYNIIGTGPGRISCVIERAFELLYPLSVPYPTHSVPYPGAGREGYRGLSGYLDTPLELSTALFVVTSSRLRYPTLICDTTPEYLTFDA